MEVQFVMPDLRKLDGLRFEAMFVPFFEDERPLRGALGLIDWRLAGRVSAMIRAGRVTGRAGETALVPSGGKLAVEKLLLRGLGPSAGFSEVVFDDCLSAMLQTLTRAGVRSSVMVLPGRGSDAIEPVTAMERFLRVAEDHPEHDDVTLVEDAEAQRAMDAVLLRAKRAASAFVP